MIDGAPAFTSDSADSADLCVANNEGRNVSNNGSVVSHTENVDLESGSQYAFPLPVAADSGDGVDVAVYRAGDSQPYRLVHVGGATEGQ